MDNLDFRKYVILERTANEGFNSLDGTFTVLEDFIDNELLEWMEYIGYRYNTEYNYYVIYCRPLNRIRFNEEVKKVKSKIDLM